MEIRTLALDGPQPDIPELCARVSEACRDGPTHVVCDVRAVKEPGLATIDALARMALTARRHGTPFRVTGASGRLRALLDLVGLVELLGEPEQREPAVGVEEGIEPDDLAV
ncbi:STAS domain-containing protein [Streptomyces sp. APSN-46.1]|uniref:STAS domain-containing protein n=1 Tax=Streptomyces sp. APSN-46.1 TaxID=2929049 RepID=UPI001FB33E46|nr:STAS domain-containing protein [Streptomyces sp. APSN-46.1]MCJ1677731.1 STAS domain-containing protein [Streptomyces sp. APSN-46.1]